MYWHSDLTKLTAPWSAVLTVAILVKWRPKFRRQLKQEEARRKPLRNAQFPRFMFNVSINLLRNVFCIIIWIYILVLWSTYWKIEGFLWDLWQICYSTVWTKIPSFKPSKVEIEWLVRLFSIILINFRYLIIFMWNFEFQNPREILVCNNEIFTAVNIYIKLTSLRNQSDMRLH